MRMCEEFSKTLNSVVEYIKFITEKEQDYDTGFLPTLDFQTKVLDTGKIKYKFFIKPMSNNTTIHYGTGLPKSTIFSALRQELVCRMLNCSLDLEWNQRLEVIECIQ